MKRTFLLLAMLIGPALHGADAQRWVRACDDGAVRNRCGSWLASAYYSVSQEGFWFAGISGGAEYFILPEFSLSPSLSPGIAEGYFYLAPSIDVNYYVWHNTHVELGVGYGYRYFYEWPLKHGAETSGTFHGPAVFAAFAVTARLSAGINVSYQWIQFGDEYSRAWYFTLPVYWYF